MSGVVGSVMFMWSGSASAGTGTPDQGAEGPGPRPCRDDDAARRDAARGRPQAEAGARALDGGHALLGPVDGAEGQDLAAGWPGWRAAGSPCPRSRRPRPRRPRARDTARPGRGRARSSIATSSPRACSRSHLAASALHCSRLSATISPPETLSSMSASSFGGERLPEADRHRVEGERGLEPGHQIRVEPDEPALHLHVEAAGVRGRSRVAAVVDHHDPAALFGQEPGEAQADDPARRSRRRRTTAPWRSGSAGLTPVPGFAAEPRQVGRWTRAWPAARGAK